MGRGRCCFIVLVCSISFLPPCFSSPILELTASDYNPAAGKDRTGVLAALLLSLAGASKEVIAHDYVLTRIGVEPSRDMLLQMLKLWNKEWTAETPGMQEFVQVRGEFILAFLEQVEERFGGVEGWVRNVLGFGEEDVERVRGVLTGRVPAS
jgi:protein tyrosine/serine phosphatase